MLMDIETRGIKYSIPGILDWTVVNNKGAREVFPDQQRLLSIPVSLAVNRADRSIDFYRLTMLFAA